MSNKTTFRPTGVIKNVALGNMHIDPLVQRERKEWWINKLVKDFDVDKIGLPILSDRGDNYFVKLDGQHLTEAVKIWLGDGWEKQKIDCRVFTGLTRSQEASIFLDVNSTMPVTPFDRFRVAVEAGRPDEVHINNIVIGANLSVSQNKSLPGSIGAVSTLLNIYKKSDGNVLAKTLRVLRDSFGDGSYRAILLTGFSLLCQRYDGTLNETEATEKLRTYRGGYPKLLQNAGLLEEKTGQKRKDCVAAAAVDIINRGRGKNLLSNYWLAV